jgi:hypothetical protein
MVKACTTTRQALILIIKVLLLAVYSPYATITFDAEMNMSSTNSKKRAASPAEDNADPKRSRTTTAAMLNTNIPANEDVESLKNIEVDNKGQANKAEADEGSGDEEESEEETVPMQNRARAEFCPEVRYSTASLYINNC